MAIGQHYNILRLEKEYKEKLRKGSNSLYFASCRESNETWLPLLEKAYAKAHGDYVSATALHWVLSALTRHSKLFQGALPVKALRTLLEACPHTSFLSLYWTKISFGAS